MYIFVLPNACSASMQTSPTNKSHLHISQQSDNVKYISLGPTMCNQEQIISLSGDNTQNNWFN